MPTAATVYISESNGAGESVTDNISNINFGSVDQPNIVAANHPIIQTEFGFNKYLRFKVNSLGDSTTIKDLRAWKSAGVYVTDEQMLIRDFQGTGGVIAYATPTQGPTAGGDQNIATGDPGTAIIDIAGALAGTITVAPDYSGYFIFKYQTGAATPVGPVNTKTLTFQYDET